MNKTNQKALPTRVALFVVSLYRQIVSPWLPPACRFVPTCSEYAAQSVEERGIVQGGLKALARVFRCHPLRPGGVDLP